MLIDRPIYIKSDRVNLPQLTSFMMIPDSRCCYLEGGSVVIVSVKEQEVDFIAACAATDI